jgi:hypothetical protein
VIVFYIVREKKEEFLWFFDTFFQEQLRIHDEFGALFDFYILYGSVFFNH